jgi:hypothetical protein
MINFLVSLLFILLSFTNIKSQVLWSNFTGGAGVDMIGDVCTDSQGNIYSLSRFYGTVDFDPGDGVVNITGTGIASISIQKFNNLGELLWVEVLLAENEIQGHRIACDESSNIYISGLFNGTTDFDPSFQTHFETATGDTDAYILKLNSEGDFQWVNTYNGESFKFITSLAVSSQGDLLVAGYFFGTVDFDPGAGEENFVSQGGTDVFIQKIESNGNLGWNRQISSLDNVDATGITLDTEDNIYLIGGFEGTTDFDPGIGIQEVNSTNNFSQFFLKLDNNGSFQWIKSLESSSYLSYEDIASDSEDNIVLEGTFSGTCDFDPSFVNNSVSSSDNSVFIQRFNNGGELQSIYTLGVNQGSILGGDMSINSQGGVLISGAISSSMVDFDETENEVFLELSPNSTRYLLYLNEDNEFMFVHSIYGISTFMTKTELSLNDELYLIGHFTDSIDVDLSENDSYISAVGMSDLFVYKIGFALSITEPIQNILDFELYPNPSKGYINIAFKEFQVFDLQIIDTEGRIVMEKSHKAIEYKMDLNHLNSGVYFLKISSIKGSAVRKVILQ